MPDSLKLKRAAKAAPYIAPPVQRAVRLIRHIAEGHPVLNMSETAKALKINRTTLLRLLYTLEAEGFVERCPNGGGFQVGLSFVELGEWHTVIGLIIASAKTLLVVLFFMHVWYSTRLTWVVVLSGLFFLAIMLGLTLTDYMSRKWMWL